MKNVYSRFVGEPSLSLLVGVSAIIVFMSIAVISGFFFPAHKVVADNASVGIRAVKDEGTLEVHIATNGLVLLRDAQVVAVNGTTFTVRTAWGSVNFLWTIKTDTSSYGAHTFGTRFLNKSGVVIGQDVHVGDMVTITGMLDSAVQEPTVNADSVRSL